VASSGNGDTGDTFGIVYKPMRPKAQAGWAPTAEGQSAPSFEDEQEFEQELLASSSVFALGAKVKASTAPLVDDFGGVPSAAVADPLEVMRQARQGYAQQVVVEAPPQQPVEPDSPLPPVVGAVPVTSSSSGGAEQASGKVWEAARTALHELTDTYALGLMDAEVCDYVCA
jgi:hypothetical protein